MMTSEGSLAMRGRPCGYSILCSRLLANLILSGYGSGKRREGAGCEGKGSIYRYFKCRISYMG